MQAQRIGKKMRTKKKPIEQIQKGLMKNKWQFKTQNTERNLLKYVCFV